MTHKIQDLSRSQFENPKLRLGQFQTLRQKKMHKDETLRLITKDFKIGSKVSDPGGLDF